MISGRCLNIQIVYLEIFKSSFQINFLGFKVLFQNIILVEKHYNRHCHKFVIWGPGLKSKPFAIGSLLWIRYRRKPVKSRVKSNSFINAFLLVQCTGINYVYNQRQIITVWLGWYGRQLIIFHYKETAQ